jgi:hypothetical protein
MLGKRQAFNECEQDALLFSLPLFLVSLCACLTILKYFLDIAHISLIDFTTILFMIAIAKALWEFASPRCYVQQSRVRCLSTTSTKCYVKGPDGEPLDDDSGFGLLAGDTLKCVSIYLIGIFFDDDEENKKAALISRSCYLVKESLYSRLLCCVPFTGSWKRLLSDLDDTDKEPKFPEALRAGYRARPPCIIYYHEDEYESGLKFVQQFKFDIEHSSI